MPRTKKVTLNPGESPFASESAKPGKIILALISPLPFEVLSLLSDHLQHEFHVPVEQLKLDWEVSSVLNPRRGQYSSPKILKKLRTVPKGAADKILGIVDVDLYCPDYDFIFGEADAQAGVATLSVYRLKQDTTDKELIVSRILKEATHEIGHLFNLGHCDDPQCVMSFSTGNLWQIDAKSASICPDCRSTGSLRRLKTIHN